MVFRRKFFEKKLILSKKVLEEARKNKASKEEKKRAREEIKIAKLRKEKTSAIEKKLDISEVVYNKHITGADVKIFRRKRIGLKTGVIRRINDMENIHSKKCVENLVASEQSVEKLKSVLNSTTNEMIQKTISERIAKIKSTATAAGEVSNSGTNQEETSASIIVPVDNTEAGEDVDDDARRRLELIELIRVEKRSSKPSKPSKPSKTSKPRSKSC